MHKKIDKFPLSKINKNYTSTKKFMSYS